MSDVVQRAVDAMRVDLGLGPLTEPAGHQHVFETAQCEIVIEAAPDGNRAIMVGRLGWLSHNKQIAGDEIQQMLRLGLALAPLNTAAIGPLPEANEFTHRSIAQDKERLTDIAVGKGRPMALGAWADCGLDGKTAGSALRDILQWAELALDILAGDAQLMPTAKLSTPVADEMVIFRP